MTRDRRGWSYHRAGPTSVLVCSAPYERPATQRAALRITWRTSSR